MKENEAIEYLQNRYLVVGSPANPPKEECEKHNEVVEMAIKALEEVQQYRAIGTPEECRVAMKKQTAKKIESPWCPCCGKFLTTEYMNKRYHCIYCGQLLEWEGER